uniref:p12-16p n=1 Tax=Pyrococcus sp. 12/1 TaxID=758582 RepID=D6MY22_9EURY|nr:hypothetical protein [Pyrococcus sp. 12/1]ADF80223.1 p12-16p [Pyrococcus sp. 12/1]
MRGYNGCGIKELLILAKLIPLSTVFIPYSKVHNSINYLCRVSKKDLHELKVAILEKRTFSELGEATRFVYNFLVERGYSWDVAFEVARILRRFFEKGMFIEAYYPSGDLLFLLDALSSDGVRTIPLHDEVPEGVRA